MAVVKWTASRIDCANYCRMRYYLRYIEHSKELRLSVFEKGGLFHNLIEHFWERFGKPEEIKRNRLGTITSKKKYSNAQEFAAYTKGKWNQRVVSAIKSARPIAWRYWREWEDIRDKMVKVAPYLFNKIIEEGKPLFTEKQFRFSLGGRQFWGKIDEIRIRKGKVVIRDYKSGIPWLDKSKVKHDPQLTFYNTGLCALCYNDEELARTLNLENRAKKYMGNPIYIEPKFKEEFFMIEALPMIASPEDYPNLKKPPQLLLKTKRTDNHFFELIKMIDGIEEAVRKGDFYPERGRKCSLCSMKVSCDKKLKEAGSGQLVDKNNQLHFDYVFPAYVRENDVAKRNPDQTRLKLRRKPIRKKSTKKT